MDKSVKRPYLGMVLLPPLRSEVLHIIEATNVSKKKVIGGICVVQSPIVQKLILICPAAVYDPKS